MKVFLIAFALFFSLQSQAANTLGGEITESQQAQLLKVLNQLDPDTLDSLLSDEAYSWYIKQFQRSANQDMTSLDITNDRTPIGGDFNDPNAPDFL